MESPAERRRVRRRVESSEELRSLALLRSGCLAPLCTCRLAQPGLACWREHTPRVVISRCNAKQCFLPYFFADSFLPVAAPLRACPFSVEIEHVKCYHLLSTAPGAKQRSSFFTADELDAARISP